MIYLLSQMSLIILLAAVAGGAIGWAFQRLQGQQRVGELQRVIKQQQQQVKQAQTEVSMVAQDYDELKQSSSSTIDGLRQDNEQIPNLHQNLEKSQLLVRQLMQKHEAQIREYASENEILKGKVKHLDDRERALNKLQADVEQGRREINHARKNANTTDKSEQLDETKPQTAASTDAKTPEEITSAGKVNTASSEQTSKSTSAAPSSEIPAGNTASAADENEASATSTQTPTTSSTVNAGVLLASHAGAKAHANTTSQSIADLTEIARQRAENARTDDLDMSADVSGEAGSLTIALAEADVVLAAIDKKREESLKTIADDEVIDASDIDFDMEFDDEDDPLPSAEPLFDPVDQHDDLQTIFGIGPVTERGLNRLGITSYSQLAELKRHDIERIANALEIVPGKIERENWVGNARRQLEDVLEEL